MIDVALVSVIRRWHLRDGMPIREIARRTGLSRNSVRKYLASQVVERFFGSLKYDWISTVAQPTRDHMKQNVGVYIRYYKNDRLHSTNSSMSPVNYELSERKVSG